MAGVKSYSTTAASNTLANTGFTMDEGMAPSAVNDSVRQLMADIKTEWSKATDIASATTPDITGTATTSGGFVHITGTTTITGFATATAGIRRRVVFDGALLLTHNATSLILPGGANITTAANDSAEFVSEGSGNWRCLRYTYSGIAVFNAGLSVVGASSFAAGTVGAPGLYLGADTTSGLYRIGANNYGVAISGAKVLDIASTGLAVTGALTATGDITGGNLLTTGLTTVGTSLAIGTGTTTRAGFRLVAGTAVSGGVSGYATLWAENIAPSATNYTLLTKYDNTVVYLNSVSTVAFAVGATPIATATSTGLAVTGALSSTGALTTNGGLQTFGANDSGGAGKRLVYVPNA